MVAPRTVALACATLAIATGCAVSEPARPTFQIGVTGAMTHLDPARGDEPGTILVSRYVFQTLPQVASAVRHSGDDRTWTFGIPHGLRFSDGTTLDAPAVAANFERWRLGWFDSDGYFAYARTFMDPKRPSAALDAVRAIDRDTLQIRTHGAFQHLDAALADPHFAIGSPQAFEPGNERFDRMPVGSGPYVVVAWHPGSDVVLGPAPHAGPDRYASVYVRDIVDDHTTVISVRKDDVAVVYGFPPQYLNEAASYDLRAVLDRATGYYCAWSPTYPLRKRVCPPAASARDAGAEPASP